MAVSTKRIRESIRERIGEIRFDAAYTLDNFKAISGLGTAALRKARREGLKVRRVGRVAFVLGKDFLAYVEQHASEAK